MTRREWFLINARIIREKHRESRIYLINISLMYRDAREDYMKKSKKIDCSFIPYEYYLSEIQTLQLYIGFNYN